MCFSVLAWTILFLYLFAFVVLGLVSSELRQEIDWEERLWNDWNDLFWIEWDVKPMSVVLNVNYWVYWCIVACSCTMLGEWWGGVESGVRRWTSRRDRLWPSTQWTVATRLQRGRTSDPRRSTDTPRRSERDLWPSRTLDALDSWWTVGDARLWWRDWSTDGTTSRRQDAI